MLADLQEAVGELAGSCEEPQADPPFVVCRTTDGSTITMTAHPTRERLRDQLQESLDFDAEFESPDTDAEEPQLEQGAVLGDTWLVGVTNEQSVSELLEDLQERLGGRRVASLQEAVDDLEVTPS